jgi:hypothetical protein
MKFAHIFVCLSTIFVSGSSGLKYGASVGMKNKYIWSSKCSTPENKINLDDL